MDSEPSTVAQAVLDQLSRTKGWALFISVLLWMGVAGMLFTGIMVFVILNFGGIWETFDPAELPGTTAIFTVFPLVYIGYGALLVYPALKLGKYSGRIGTLLKNATEDSLVAALNEQRGFWKSAGIAILIAIALYLVLIAIFMTSALAEFAM